MKSKDKVELLKHYRICFYCLRHRFNPIRPCNRNILICDVIGCNEKHVTEMHPQQKITHTNVTKNMADSFSNTILPTAIANIMSIDKSSVPVRCLLDQCSQSSYITEDLVQKLRLPRKRTNVKNNGGRRSCHWNSPVD